jgi:flagellar assembly protein FliH
VEKSTSKVINGKVISGADSANCVPWQAPAVGVVVPIAVANEHEAPITAAAIEEIQRQAYDEAFALGRREGLEQGRRHMQTQAERLAAIIELLDEPLRALDACVVDEVMSLVMVVARHVVRRELKTDPGQIVAVVQQAAAALPVAARGVRLILHPDDAAIVHEAFSAEGDAPRGGWQIVQDPSLMRGGCRVETDDSRIDASVEKRLAAIAAELLGGERGSDGERQSA